MSELDHSVREITDKLDSVGNTTAAIGKGFAIGSAALTALALFASYAESVGLTPSDMSIMDPTVLIGMLIGGMLPYLFSALTMSAVGKAAYQMIDEVRRQFKEIPGIMEGKSKPNTPTASPFLRKRQSGNDYSRRDCNRGAPGGRPFARQSRAGGPACGRCRNRRARRHTDVELRRRLG
jgi:Na+/H+-translocating membrane pyrophosphatase